MSKTCKTMEEALATQHHYMNTKDIESYIVERDGEFWFTEKKMVRFSNR